MTTELVVQDGHPTLRHEERHALGVILQRTLVELTDLALIGKQLHWNVQGFHFRSLHLQLDELVDAWRALGDRVAERAVMLGVSPDGRVATIAEHTPFDATEIVGPLEDALVVDYLTGVLAEAISLARKSMEQSGELDDVSNDLLIDVVNTLEEQLWMVSVQRVDTHGGPCSRGSRATARRPAVVAAPADGKAAPLYAQRRACCSCSC
jgi:starvation-inducible DNA-binding protein